MNFKWVFFRVDAGWCLHRKCENSNKRIIWRLIVNWDWAKISIFNREILKCAQQNCVICILRDSLIIICLLGWNVFFSSLDFMTPYEVYDKTRSRKWLMSINRKMSVNQKCVHKLIIVFVSMRDGFASNANAIVDQYWFVCFLPRCEPSIEMEESRKTARKLHRCDSEWVMLRPRPILVSKSEQQWPEQSGRNSD